MSDGAVLVTGGLGYLGSELLRLSPAWLSGHTVRVLDNLATRGERALVDLPSGCRYEFVEGDVLDPGVLRYALRGVDTVVHLAGVVRTPMSFEHPTWMRQVNTWGTAAVAEASLRAGVRRLVFSSSTAVYGPGGPFDESAACRPVGPYAGSKRAAEEALLAAEQRGLSFALLRLGMLYGHAPGARYDGFVNRLLFLAGTGRAMTVYGSGEQRRPIVHVSDAADAVLRAATADAGTSTVHNVVESNASVLDVVEAVKAVRPTVAVRFTEQDVLSHLSFLVDGERIRRSGWQPAKRLREAVGEELARFARLGAVPSPADEAIDALD
ncbi:MAG: NAD(P)-dependent oxidoreductase [Trueperaceae bacterium]